MFIAKGGGGAQPNISKEIIVNTAIPLPPLAEQERIVTEIESLLALIDEIEQGKADLQTTIKQKAKSLTLRFMANLYRKIRMMNQRRNFLNVSIRKRKSLVITHIIRSYLLKYLKIGVGQHLEKLANGSRVVHQIG